MTKTRIETGTEAAFFARGKRLARQADGGEPLTETHIVTFDDPTEVAQLLTPAHIGVFRSIKAEPVSINTIAARPRRSRVR
jgi:predicted transcriptional regulator